MTQAGQEESMLRAGGTRRHGDGGRRGLGGAARPQQEVDLPLLSQD